MKHYLFTIFFALFIFSSFAQTKEGTKIIGGNAGFSFSKDKQKVSRTTTDGWKYYNFYLSPNLGFFIMDNLAVGGKLNLSSSVSKLDDGLNLGGNQRADSRVSGVQFSLGPWARYYFPVGTKAAVFVDGNLGFGVEGFKSRSVSNGEVVTITSPTHKLLQAGIGPGYTYFLTPNVGLEGLLQLKVDRSSYKEDGTNVKIVDSNVGIFFNIGLQVYF